ncbi:iron complex transport system permease protein [Microbacterium halimionae]|uniref:Iron complex transport system permease protein n=1 Tax=Microbacterium halimionae TaxID=1526413 RepID=A0A7W3JPU3_9MICO|nr:iron ABC transporter permease [Microbacterium halimionae]MBA8816790.1 iron complex transport system permease protein [Microbacterium halimionae]NII94914.1 iron complex transport system permease protein [Microbacterium halimionae]
MTFALDRPRVVADRLRRDRRQGAWRIGGLAASALVIALVAMGIGPVAIDPATVVSVLAHHLFGAPLPVGTDDIAQQIVWGTRAPRVAMAVVAGAGLAMAGAVLQSLVRNDLADPYLMGVNAGASTGVALVVLVIGGASGLLLSGAALLGAVAATALVVLIAGTARTRGPFRLVLAGLAVGYALNAATSFLLFWSDSPEAARSVLFWLLGSIATVQPTVLIAAVVTVAAAAIFFTSLSPRIDALASGDDSALAAGLDPEKWRFGLMAAASALVGVVVAGVGGVGFIGLVVPHLARAIVGGRSRLVLPASAALGAGLLVLADTVARTALSPQEIPVGVVTGVIGAPFLLFLLRRSGRAGD